MSATALAAERAPASARRGAAPLVLAAAAFLVSGASGLVYQVAWQRILALMSGVGIYSIAMIVAAFMAGLGAGSHLGGRHSLRLTPRRALLTFALVELGIGAFGAASCWLYYDVLHRRAPFLYASPWTAGVMHFVTLAIPTFLMGTSLPFLVRALVGEARTAGRTIGVLYGINLLGAAVGALLTPWLLIRYYGVRGAVLWAAAGNATAGLIAIALFAYFRQRGTDPDPAPAPAVEASGGGETQRLALWMGLYALSGFCALSLEKDALRDGDSVHVIGGIELDPEAPAGASIQDPPLIVRAMSAILLGSAWIITKAVNITFPLLQGVVAAIRGVPRGRLPRSIAQADARRNGI